MRRRDPRRRFVREMVIGILLGPVTSGPLLPPSLPDTHRVRRGSEGGGEDRFKRSQGGRDSSTLGSSLSFFLASSSFLSRECSRIWRKIVTATRIYLRGRNRLRERQYNRPVDSRSSAALSTTTRRGPVECAVATRRDAVLFPPRFTAGFLKRREKYFLYMRNIQQVNEAFSYAFRDINCIIPRREKMRDRCCLKINYNLF